MGAFCKFSKKNSIFVGYLRKFHEKDTNFWVLGEIFIQKAGKGVSEQKGWAKRGASPRRSSSVAMA